VVTISLAMAFLQDVDGAAHDAHLMRWFVGVIAVAMVAQAIGVLMAASYGAKLLMKLDKLSGSFESKTSPILAKTNKLLEELGPKIQSVSTNVEQISYTVREKVDEIGQTASRVNETVSQANSRARAQVARADSLVTEAMNTTEEVSRTVQNGIRIPVREIAGVIAGVRAAITTLVERSPFGRKDYDEGPFD
jgi:methyl-accepting chemotaxis protein